MTLGFEKNFGLPAMPADAIIVNRWLAAPSAEGGLGLAVGDRVGLSFFAVGDARQFVVRGAGEGSYEFTVAGIVDMDLPAMRDGWVPEFPGLESAGRLADWESGMPIDTKKIREADEDYWEKYRATPKAFIPLAAAQAMWGNRFGKVTALRLPGADFDEVAFTADLRGELSLNDLGMALRRPRDEAATSVSGALDFGALFGSLSGFLIMSSLLLVALLCTFGMESRAAQIGLLGAMGFRRRQLRALFLWEAGLMALAGACAGVVGGVLYTKAALWALSGVWRGASTGVDFQFFAAPGSLLAGVVGTFAVALLTLWAAGRRITARPPQELLAGQLAEGGGVRRGGRRAWWVLGIGAVGGLAMVFAASGLEGEKQAGVFFGAGFALLLAGLAAFSIYLRRLDCGASDPDLSVLGRRNAARRPGRSLAVAAMVAAGVFLVVAVNAFRLGADDDPTRLDTGTGGFAFVGNTTLPVYDDLDDPATRDRFGLEGYSPEALSFVPFRVRSGGEEASCLNLNSATRPRLIAVDPAQLAQRGAFRFAAALDEFPFDKSPWELLDSWPDSDGVVPVIGDKASVMWALKKKLGDVLIYPDGHGGELRLRIVGLLENSLLQGNLVMAAAAFTARFPDAGGYQFFLIDAPGGGDAELMREITKALAARGAAFEPAGARLATYAQVQNTYISIFSVLGGLGVLLGTAGVGLLIARNVLERRGEMGLMSALGFRRRALVGMVMGEHLLLVVAGVAIGALAAVVAVSPNLIGRAAGLPLGVVGGMVALIAVAGMGFCFVAAWLALRGSLLDAIRSE